MKRASGVMTITVEKAGARGESKKCDLEVLPTQSVGGVKGLIEETMTGIDRYTAKEDPARLGCAKVPTEERWRNMHLSYNGEELEDGRTLGDYNIQANARRPPRLNLVDNNIRPRSANPEGAAAMSGSEGEEEPWDEEWDPGSGSEAEEDSGEESEAFEPDSDYDDGEEGEDLDEDGSDLDEDDEAEGGAEAAPVFGNDTASRTPSLLHSVR